MGNKGKKTTKQSVVMRRIKQKKCMSCHYGGSQSQIQGVLGNRAWFAVGTCTRTNHAEQANVQAWPTREHSEIFFENNGTKENFQVNTRTYPPPPPPPPDTHT